MRKRHFKGLDLPLNGTYASLIIISVMFFVGCLAGCILANRVDSGGEAALSDYLDGYLSTVSSDDIAMPDPLVLFWNTVRWSLLLLLLGFTPIGLLGIPITFLVRAFLFSFSIASFYRSLSASGLLFSFVLFGIPGLICIPVLFVLGVQSFLNAGMIAGGMAGENRQNMLLQRIPIIRFALCFVVLCVVCAVEYYAIPAILESLTGLLTK